jgi:hypothetical protein
LDDSEPEDYVPPDEPEGSFEDATTASGQRDRDTLDERLEREEPDRPRRAGTEDAPGRLSDEDRPDDEDEMVGELSADIDELSSEEAAMRVRKNAPGATEDASDDYVEPEDS